MDCVAIMFAIHYFFENEMSLAGFMQNVSDCLKIGGLFIGCCFDGQRVFDALRGQEEGGTLMGSDDKGEEVWRITKRYSSTDLTNTVESLGMAVDVKFLSIGTEQKEYLVPFDLLRAEMGKIGCDLLTDAECNFGTTVPGVRSPARTRLGDWILALADTAALLGVPGPSLMAAA